MSRRTKRYENRMKERAERRKQNLGQYDSFEAVISHEALFKAAKEAAKGVNWKASVQRFQLNSCICTDNLNKALKQGKDVRKGFIEFDIVERGKRRHIKSIHFSERVVQKSLCQNALYPVMVYNLIYDNGANQKGKGTLFATQRLIKHLRQHFRHYKRDGYVLLIDFKSYFDNIRHEPIKEAFRKYFTDKRLIALSDSFIDAFGEVSLGLGSETSQMTAVAYPNKLDHYIKEVGRVKGYGRYMDDSYIIHPSKDFLQNLLKDIKNICDSLGIKLNPRKTYITDIKHGFTFLKTRFQLTETGKIIKRPCRKYITMARKKLKKQANLVKKGIMTLEQVKTSFTSWRGSMVHRNARRTVRSMDLLYKELFS